MKDNVTITFRDMKPDEELSEIARAECGVLDHRTSGRGTWTIRVRRRANSAHVCVSFVEPPRGLSASAADSDPRDALLKALHQISKRLSRPQTQKARPFLRRWDTSRQYMEMPESA